MSETANLIRDAAHRLFAQHVTNDVLHAAESGEWPTALWDAVEEAGFLDTLADRDATADGARGEHGGAAARGGAALGADSARRDDRGARALGGAQREGAARSADLRRARRPHAYARRSCASRRARVARRVWRVMRRTCCSRRADGEEAVLIATRRGQAREGRRTSPARRATI